MERIAFGRELGGAAHAFVDAGFDGLEWPAQAVVFDGAVGETMDECDLRRVALPAKQRDAAALGAEVDRDERTLVFGGPGGSKSCLAHRR